MDPDLSMAINQGRETHALWVISTKWAFVLGDESLLHMLSQYILLCEMKQISSQDKKVGTFTFWASKRSSCPTWSVMRCALLLSLVWLCDYMDCARQPMWSPPDTPLSMGILQARILQWVPMPSSRESFQPRNWTQVSCIVGGFFSIWATMV